MICQQIFFILAHFGAGDFPLKFFFKSASQSFFVALAPRSRFGATISDGIARSSSVSCNSVSADRIVMASRLLGAAAAYAILLSFAAGHLASLCASF